MSKESNEVKVILWVVTVKGGWMSVGYLNMSEPVSTCPSGLTL